MRFFTVIAIIVFFMHIGIKEVSIAGSILMFLGAIMAFGQDLKEIFK